MEWECQLHYNVAPRVDGKWGGEWVHGVGLLVSLNRVNPRVWNGVE